MSNRMDILAADHLKVFHNLDILRTMRFALTTFSTVGCLLGIPQPTIDPEVSLTRIGEE